MRLQDLFDDEPTRLMVAKAEEDARNRLARLTPMQRAILPLLCDGKMSKVVAHEIGVSTRTAEAHRAAIFERVGVRTLPELTKLLLLGG